jgi:hypothetical protein
MTQLSDGYGGRMGHPVCERRHMMRQLHIVAVVLAFLSTSITVIGQASDPWMGAWNLNLAKSKFDPGPPPKSLAANFEPSEDGFFRHTIYIVDAQGRASHTETIAKADGQDYRTVGAQRLTTRAYKRIDDRTVEITVKTGGNVQTNRFVFSADGKTMTGTATGKDAQGQPVGTMQVLEKQ